MIEATLIDGTQIEVNPNCIVMGMETPEGTYKYLLTPGNYIETSSKITI